MQGPRGESLLKSILSAHSKKKANKRERGRSGERVSEAKTDYHHRRISKSTGESDDEAGEQALLLNPPNRKTTAVGGARGLSWQNPHLVGGQRVRC